MSTYNIGDHVWTVDWETKRIVEPCPVCNTNKYIVIRDGFGQEWQIECDYCRRGWEGPHGYIQERHDQIWTVYETIITGAEISITHENDHYYTGLPPNRRLHYENTLFPTKEEAEAYASMKVADEKKAEYNKVWGKEHELKSYSWHLGRYRNDLKKAQHDVEFYQSKIALFSEKAKEVQPGRYFKYRQRVYRVVEPVPGQPGYWNCQDVEWTNSYWKFDDITIMQRYCREPKE